MSKGKGMMGAEGAIDKALDAALEAAQLPEAWKPEEKGDKIVGRFVEARRCKCRSRDGKERSPLVFILRVMGDERVSLWATANLGPQMEAMLPLLQVNDTVACRYEGERDTSAGYRVRIYSLARVV